MIVGFDKERNQNAIKSIAAMLGYLEVLEEIKDPITPEFAQVLRKELISVVKYLTELSPVERAIKFDTHSKPVLGSEYQE
jgi:hypothetical protein